jgi:SulP family sulfate permease
MRSVKFSLHGLGLYAAGLLLPFLNWTPLVNKTTIRADILAAVTGAVIVLPQGVAFAIIAGLPPQFGLYTAIVTPIIAAFFGSSRHLVSGPTTAISLVIFSAISQHAQPGSTEFISLVLTLTFMAGVYQLVFGLAQLGRLVNFVSHSVVVGFTAGAAILIVTSQIKNVIGINVVRGESFFHTWTFILSEIGNANGYVVAIATGTLAIALLLKYFFPSSPHMLLAMILGSFLCFGFDGSSNGVRLVGEIPGHLPPFSMPEFSFLTFRDLASQALAVAVLGLIEAVSIGRSIAAKTHQRINASQEFVGQGLSNIIGSFFSSYAGSGSFTRSGINYTAGAKTPIAAIMAAVFLAIILISLAPLTAYLPIPAMGGVILLVAYRLIDIHHIKTILRVSHSESAVLILTFTATLLLELEFAIYAGVLLSLVLYLNRTANPRMYSVIPCPDSIPRRFIPVGPTSNRRCPQLEILDINGAVFFGSVNAVARRLGFIYKADPLLNHVLIVADSIGVIDVSGAEMLAEESATLKDRGGALYLSGLRLEDKIFLKRGGYLDVIGRENIFLSKKVAIPEIYKRLDPERCKTCVRRIFAECEDKS